jgi:O-acetylhomoserine (thiol)-lyase
MGVTVKFVDPSDFEAWSAQSRPRRARSTARLSATPKGSILDIERLAQLASAHRIPLIVDNTFATPYLCRPLEWGATIVVHSATKFIGGTATPSLGWSSNRASSITATSPRSPRHRARITG